MTDYWVSTKKHYCEVCKCWVAGNTAGVKKHEATPRHISSLRNKMIESHKKQVAKQKHEDFVQEELKRLNTITIDNYKNLEHIQPTTSQGMSFLPGPHLRPKMGMDEEKRKISESINMKLAGIEEPEHADINISKSRWTAFIDSNDGTLTYYNNFTGIKTKIRPMDFDGNLPIASTSLTSNWTLKYDPIKKNNYYYNNVTKEVRWIESSTNNIQHAEVKSNESDQEMGKSAVTSSTISKIDIKIKREINKGVIESNVSTCDLSHDDKSVVRDSMVKKELQTEDHPRAQKQLAPVIGSWEVVEPNNSEFSHCIESIEPYYNSLGANNEKRSYDNESSTDQRSTLDEDDLKLMSKPKYTKKDMVSFQNVEDSGSISFTRRKLLKKRNGLYS